MIIYKSIIFFERIYKIQMIRWILLLFFNHVQIDNIFGLRSYKETSTEQRKPFNY